jgi:hypothetical protein
MLRSQYGMASISPLDLMVGDTDAPVRLPGVLVNASGSCDKSHSVSRHPEPYVKMARFVLTPPCLELLTLVADCMHDDSSCGVQLTGVHGAGKSAFLEALVGIMCVGGRTDALHSSDAERLVWSPENSLLDIVLCSTGAFIDLLLGKHRNTVADSRSREYVKSLYDVVIKPERELQKSLGGNKWMEKQLQANEAVLQNLYTYCITSEFSAPDEYSVVIFDELNDIQARLNNKWGGPRSAADGSLESFHAKCGEFFKQTLPWKHFVGKPRCLRILAATTDGECEEFLNHGHAAFFELRPPRADHLAAILACAPEYFGIRMYRDMSAHMSVTQIENTFGMLSCSLFEVKQFLESYSGLAGMDRDKGESLSACRNNLFSGAIINLGRELSRTSLTTLQRSRDSWIQLMLHNASMVVREDPHSSASGYKLSGLPAVLAAGRIMIASRIEVYPDHYGRQGYRMKAVTAGERMTIHEALWDTTLKIMHEDSLKKRVQRLFQVGIFPAASWRMDLFGLKRPANVTAAKKSTADFVYRPPNAWGEAASLSTGATELCCNASFGPAVLNPDLCNYFGQSRSASRSLEGTSGALLIQVDQTYPYIDHIVLHWEGKKRTVTLFQVVESPFAAYAAGKPDTVPASGTQKDTGTGEVYLVPSVRGLVDGLHSVRRCVTQKADGSILIAPLPKLGERKRQYKSMKAAKSKQNNGAVFAMATGSTGSTGSTAGLSTMNAILAALGAPLVVECTFIPMKGSATQHTGDLDTAFVRCHVAVDDTHVKALYGIDAASGIGCTGVDPSSASASQKELSWSIQLVYVAAADSARQRFDVSSYLDAPFIFVAIEH